MRGSTATATVSVTFMIIQSCALRLDVKTLHVCNDHLSCANFVKFSVVFTLHQCMLQGIWTKQHLPRLKPMKKHLKGQCHWTSGLQIGSSANRLAMSRLAAFWTVLQQNLIQEISFFYLNLFLFFFFAEVLCSGGLTARWSAVVFWCGAIVGLNVKWLLAMAYPRASMLK